MPTNDGKRKPRATRLDRIEAALERLTEIAGSTDRRLDRLTERQDALAQTVELLTHDVQQDAANIRALARIAEIHERRISNLEEPPQR